MIKRECIGYIKSDLWRVNPKQLQLKGFLHLFLKQPTSRFLIFFRLSNCYSANTLIGFLARLFYYILKPKYGIQIPLKTQIGKGFNINHYGNIIINQNAVLGSNCNVAQGVTIGNVSRGKLKGSPIIGDNVWIGANSIVAGNITVGKNVLIAPLSYVISNVPDNAVIAGNPSVIQNFNGTKYYIKNVFPINE